MMLDGAYNDRIKNVSLNNVSWNCLPFAHSGDKRRQLLDIVHNY